MDALPVGYTVAAMGTPVTIENDALRLVVWPAYGGKVSSLFDKAGGAELLFNYPAELPTGPRYDVPHAKAWYAGWDECFPALAPGKYHGHPYDGIPVPDHGELWGIPTVAVPTKDGITTVWHGLRFGYRLTRKLYLDGPAVRAEYTLINLAPFDFRFVWAMNALLAMDGPVELAAEGSPAFRWSHGPDGTDVQRPFDWPAVEPGLDLSRPATLPARRAWKVFSTEPITHPIRVVYPATGRALRIEYTSADVSAYWGVWVNTGGWAGHRHLAPVPTAGRFDALDRAIRDGSAGRVGPSGRCEWAVSLSLG